jgi:putative phosphonate metabolism protein
VRPRFAIYWAPRPGSPLAAFGAEWLGRDAEDGRAMPQPAVPDIARMTAEPRRYGFHATLKPPFALAEGCDEAALLDAVASLAITIDVLALPPLQLDAIGRFLALVPSAPAPDVERLAASCVARLDRFRAPLSPDELARRRQARLTPAQDALLQRWGYPYVFEEYRFHLTLTGPLTPEERAAIEPVLVRRTAPLYVAPVRVEDLVVFVEEGAGAPFRVRARFPLRGA